MQEEASRSGPSAECASMMQAYSMIHAATDEGRKKRNRIAKRKSRQRQAQQANAMENHDGLGSVTFSGELGGESCSRGALSAEICEDQEITTSYSKIATQTGGIWSPVLTPTQISRDTLVGSMNEAYELDPQTLSELSPLECFGSTSEEPVTQIWSGSIDRQLANLRDSPGPSVLMGDIESAPTLWASSTSEVQAQLPQEQQQERGQQSRREPALHRAVITGEKDIVQLLLQHQANVNSRDKNGRTALDLAIDIGHVAMVQILLAHGADMEGN